MERKHDIRFFVYVLESPSSNDMYEGTSEGDFILKAASLNNIPSTLKIVPSKETLIKALKIGLYEEMLRYDDRLPIIHLSAHGFSEGIELTDKTILSWSELREYFKPINKAFKGNLMLCMSSCKGFGASRMAMYPEDKEFPFFSVIGNGGDPTWPETAVAYATFYHHMANGQYIPDAIAAMKLASGNDGFYTTTAQAAYDGYIDFLKKDNANSVRTELAQNLEKDDPGQTEEIKKKLNKS